MASQLKSLPLKDLELDLQNPRLSLEQREKKLNQAALLRVMYEQFQLEELAESFLHSGFFEHEPIVAIPAKSGRTFTVIEGNRRLAALKLLAATEETSGISSSYIDSSQKRFRSLPANQRESLTTPKVAIVAKRSDVAGYIGFRHVTGIKQWAALEKAGYIASLIDDGMDPGDVASVIGSKPVYVARHYQAYRVIMQARETEMVDTSQIEDQFGVFMRALQTSGVREFIKVPAPDKGDLEAKPLKPNAKKPFSEFVKWAFGTTTIKPIFTDSRRLTDFGKILQSEKALEYIRSMPQPDFEKAHYLSGGEDQAALESLQVAEFSLRDTVPYARRMKNKAAFGESLGRCADYFAQILTHFPQLREEFFAEDGKGKAR